MEEKKCWLTHLKGNSSCPEIYFRHPVLLARLVHYSDDLIRLSPHKLQQFIIQLWKL